MDWTYRWIRPLLFSMDAERAHQLSLGLAGWASRFAPALWMARKLYCPPVDPRLRVDAFGLEFANPVGLAAGLDKDGDAIDLWAALGFGLVEVGTVTPGTGQPGNQKPRLERIREDDAIVNRMGFNNRGADALAKRLSRRKTPIPVGANLGKAKQTPLENAPDDYESTLRAVWPVADYIVINVSSPNTPGLRDLQAVRSLEPLVSRVLEVNQELGSASGNTRPILIKVAPDLADDDLDALADLAVDMGISGIIATNTTLKHERLSRTAHIAGGVSGPPLKTRALEVTRRLRRRLGAHFPLVGVGGIRSAYDAYERIRSGATLVQMYTGLVYEGPHLVRTIVKGLADYLTKDGYDSITDVMGVDV